MNEPKRPSGTFRTKLGLFQFEFTSSKRVSIDYAQSNKGKPTIAGKAFASIHGHLEKTGIDAFRFPYKDALVAKRQETMHETTRAQYEEIKSIIEDTFIEFWKGNPLLQRQHELFVKYCERKVLLMRMEEESKKIADASANLIDLKAKLEATL